ncbi:MAG: hypothetical protein JNL34_11755 [Anaerolineae bacterium]|nr:hypothetical protein [Anaerolineae bacterium]
MRTYQTLDRAEVETDRDILTLTSATSSVIPTSVALRREGIYLAMSFSLGPAELALRLKTADVTRALTHLQPADGLQTPRQIGSGQAFLQVGLQLNGVLLLRPTLVSDANGMISFNLSLEHAARRALLTWLELDPG